MLYQDMDAYSVHVHQVAKDTMRMVSQQTQNHQVQDSTYINKSVNNCQLDKINMHSDLDLNDVGSLAHSNFEREQSEKYLKYQDHDEFLRLIGRMQEGLKELPKTLFHLYSYSHTLVNQHFYYELCSLCCNGFTDKTKKSLRNLPYQAIKIAWAFHACHYEIPHEHSIKVSTMQMAIAICKRLMAHIIYACEPTGLRAYNDAKTIHKNLCQINTPLDSETLPYGYITSRILKQRVNMYGERFYNAILFLQRNGVVDVLDNGKASNIIVLHPNYGQFSFE